MMYMNLETGELLENLNAVYANANECGYNYDDPYFVYEYYTEFYPNCQ